LSSAKLQEQQLLQQLACESFVVLRPLLLHWVMSQLDLLLLSNSGTAGILLQNLNALLRLASFADPSEALAVKCTALQPLFQSVLPHVLRILDTPGHMADSAQTTSSSSSNSSRGSSDRSNSSRGRSSAGCSSSSSGSSSHRSSSSGGSSSSNSSGSRQGAAVAQEMLEEQIPGLQDILCSTVEGCECYW
jgi:hypothetical protein